jgi:accessory colonization factor AcfC
VCTGFWWGSLRERDHWRNPDVDGKIIWMDLQEVGGGYRDWMERAEDRDRWRALVCTVMNFRVP